LKLEFLQILILTAFCRPLKGLREISDLSPELTRGANICRRFRGWGVEAILDQSLRAPLRKSVSIPVTKLKVILTAELKTTHQPQSGGIH
jgi:hypothetical protein